MCELSGLNFETPVQNSVDLISNRVKWQQYKLPISPADGSILYFSNVKRMMIYDNHKFFFVLNYLLYDRRGFNLVAHVDRHWDTRRSELSHCGLLYKINDLKSCHAYVDLILQDGDFLIAAISGGYLKNLVFCVPSSKGEWEVN